MVACGLAFLGLNNLPVAKRQQVKHSTYDLDAKETQAHERGIELGSTEEKKSNPDKDDHSENLSTISVIILLVILAVVSGLSNGVIPAIQSYACIPYSYYIYHLTLTLSNIANPVTCFVFPFIRTQSTVVMEVLCCVYLGMCTYIIVIASQSPNVLLQCDDSGAALIVSRLCPVKVYEGILHTATSMKCITLKW